MAQIRRNDVDRISDNTASYYVNRIKRIGRYEEDADSYVLL
jgi:hypothetical protein